MEISLNLVSFIIEVIAFILFFSVVYYIYTMKSLTKGFGEVWNYITIGFLLIIFRRGISLFRPLLSESYATILIEKLIQPLLLLSISIVFLYGFFKLNRLFLSIALEKRDGKKQKRK